MFHNGLVLASFICFIVCYISPVCMLYQSILIPYQFYFKENTCICSSIFLQLSTSSNDVKSVNQGDTKIKQLVCGIHSYSSFLRTKVCSLICFSQVNANQFCFRNENLDGVTLWRAARNVWKFDFQLFYRDLLVVQLALRFAFRFTTNDTANFLCKVAPTLHACHIVRSRLANQ